MRRYFSETAICLFIITALLFVFHQTHNYSYILYDDIIPLRNSYVTSGLTLKKVFRAFYDPLPNVPYTSPIPVIIRMVQWELVGNNFGAQHLFSLLFHTATAIMLFILLRSTTKKVWESGFCMALFALHPLNVEPVVWLAGMNVLLEAFFLTATLLLYYTYTQKPSFPRYMLVFPPFFLGMLCKPTTAVLPLLLLCLDYWPFQRLAPIALPLSSLATTVRNNWGKVILEKIPFFLVVVLQIFGQALFSGDPFSALKTVSFHFHPGALLHFAVFLKNIIYPADLTICYPPPPAASMEAAVAVLSGFVFITGFIFWKSRSHKYIIAGWLWFLITSFPVILMVSLSGKPVADRHLYIPLIGIWIILSFGLGTVMKSIPFKKTLRFFLPIFFLAPLMLVSHTQTRHWKNSLTIFHHALSIHPDNQKALANLGDALLEKEEINSAIHYYRRLVRLIPESAPAHTKLAKALSLQGAPEEAAFHYQTALALSPGYAFAHHNYADFLFERKETEKAIRHYRLALSISPRLFQTHNNLATALLTKGETVRAVFHLQQALAVNPDYETARENLRKIYRQKRYLAPQLPPAGKTLQVPRYFPNTDGSR